ncbi:class I SAM-dependent methyltransferase [Rhizobium sp. G21]|uniref:class I SAM-dependent methyltransferase n=1 Tax=Rhizobium sp. G21 TaxID=2758439 RepID=UPI0015FF6BA4|nr:class I SAM-dependent methyltransferase [Rhizobium sp. G21]MBB1248241.1 methyltransferase domain-containing protein [Rhizobium sp. G21]
MREQEDDRLYSDPRLVDFYDLENGWGQDTRYCAELARTAGSVLDFGCGTGLFLAGIADGRPMVGVDPASAMLEVARHRTNGEQVRWVEGDIRSIRLGERFDLVTMTGHAFQCLLTDADVKAALATIAAHLTPSGQFIFDSRNPARREWEGWTPEASRRTVAHPDYGKVESWNDVAVDEETGVVCYETAYRLASGETLSSRSSIRFIDQAHLAGLIARAGLVIDVWLGDWIGAPFEPGCKEIIPLGRLA